MTLYKERIKKSCDCGCGKIIYLKPSTVRKHNFYSRECVKKFGALNIKTEKDKVNWKRRFAEIKQIQDWCRGYFAHDEGEVYV